jgi:putative ABC transport system permease protein
MLQDLVFSLRELRKHLGLAVTAFLSLTLGIGATTAIFSVIYALLVNPYPYLGADRMVYLNVLDERGDIRGVGVTGPQYRALRGTNCIESLAASWGTWNLTTTDEDLPEDVPSVQLSANAGAHFGVPALLGRTFIPSDAPDGQNPQSVVLLSYRFWRRHYNSDPGVVGRNLQLVHKNYTVIGVMPERFTISDADVYTPLKIGSDPNVVFQARVRLRPGVTHTAADAELQPLFEQFARDTPTHFPKKFRMHVRGLIEGYLDHLGPALALLFAAVGVLLIVGCTNVSILLLARGTARQHELAVRSAIGAGRWRIARQLLTEALALSLAGAAGGILLAYRLLPVLVRWLPEYSFPHEVVIRLNLPVLLFTMAVGILTGVLFGLAPAFQWSQPQLAQLMQSSSRRATGGGRGKRLHRILAAGQIALTLLLLTSAAAAMNGFVRLVNAHLGYDPHHAISVGIPVHQNTHTSWEDRSAYFYHLREKIASVPGVLEAGISSNATPPYNGSDMHVEIFGRPSLEKEQVRTNLVSPEYFSVLRIPLLQGRLWDQPEIVRGARLAVINQTMAKQYWPQGDAIGKQVRLPDMKSEPPFMVAAKDSDSWLQIIGIAADARDDGLRNPVKPAIFVPYSMRMWMFTQVLVRTQTAPLANLNRIRAAVRTVDPEQQVFGRTQDLDQWIQGQDEYSFGRLVAALFTGFAVLALALAAVGLFSVISYGVAQRTNEFGIRMALGATPAGIVRLVFASTAWEVASGLFCGVVLSLLLNGALKKWAEGSSQTPLLVAAAILLLVATSVLAAVIPARRAATVDPMTALRYD